MFASTDISFANDRNCAQFLSPFLIRLVFLRSFRGTLWRCHVPQNCLKYGGETGIDSQLLLLTTSWQLIPFAVQIWIFQICRTPIFRGSFPFLIFFIIIPLFTVRNDLVVPVWSYGGGTGIRTPGPRQGSTVFKTAAFNRSAIPPNHLIFYQKPQFMSIILSVYISILPDF